MLQNSLNSVERLRALRAFVEEALQHLRENGLAVPVANTLNSYPVELPPNTTEKLKDIAADVQRLLDKWAAGGLQDQATFSTAAEDYVT
jgi:hypothetical protein